MRTCLVTTAFILMASLITVHAEEDARTPKYPMPVNAEHLAGASIQAVKDLPGSTMQTFFGDDGQVSGFVVKVNPYPYCRGEFWADAKGIIQIATGLICAKDPHTNSETH